MSLMKYYLKALFFRHQTVSQFRYGLVIHLNEFAGPDSEIWVWQDHQTEDCVDDSENSPHEDRQCCVVCAVVDSEDLPCSLPGMVDEDLSDTFHLSCLPDMGG